VCGRYENVEGLVASAPLHIKGYKAGKVTQVNYLAEEGVFEVVRSIGNDFQFPEDSKMIIYSTDIMGTKGVRIDFGQSETVAQDGTTLETAYEQGLIDGLGSSIQPLLAKVGNTLDTLSLMISNVNGMLSESNKKHIENTLANLERTMANVKSITAAVNGKSDELDDFMNNLSAFSGKLEGIVGKLDTTVAGVNGVVDQLNETDIKGLVSSFKGLIENINDPDGSLNRLMKDDSVYNSVDSLLNDVNVLVKKIQENPKKYLKISVF
jgi:phospholipid/cholesterol/gamma-HCH transport system substrate-binding protein